MSKDGGADGSPTSDDDSPRPRDSQRLRLYRAEDELDPGKNLPTVERLQSYVDDLVSAEWFRVRWGPRHFEVRPGHGHRRATASRSGVLQFPRWSRRELVVLHEVAHCLAPLDCAAHGPEYAGTLLSLVRRRLGPAAAQGLEEAFARHRVRWSVSALPRPASSVRHGEGP